MDMIRKFFIFSVLFFGADIYAKCSAVPEAVKNKYASDMFEAFVTQSYGKSTIAFFQFDTAREQAKKAGENIFKLIAIEKLFIWYRMYGSSLRLFHKNPIGDDRIHGEYKPYSAHGNYSDKNYSEWGNNPEQARLIREFMFGVGEIISGTLCAAVSGGSLGFFGGGVALGGLYHIFSTLNSLWTQHQTALLSLKQWEQTSLKPALE